MPMKDRRAKATVGKGKHRSSGKMRVTYIDAKGRTREALVLGAGTTSGLKLQITSGKRRIIDNVAKATAMNSVNAYVDRLG